MLISVARDDAASLLERVDLLRLSVMRQLTPGRQQEHGQFLTPSPTARQMAAMFGVTDSHIRLLDAGAGIGSLTAAFVTEMCQRTIHPSGITVTAYEIDPLMTGYLRTTLDWCAAMCSRFNIDFQAELREDDFISTTVAELLSPMFGAPTRFDRAILNPPYRKIGTDSTIRRALRVVGIETSNLYAAFLALVAELLEPEGEMVAITPRSFANGPYFKPFRSRFLSMMNIRRVHVFESRSHAFRDDEVLQENIILRATKERPGNATVLITASTGPDDDLMTEREIAPWELVRADDPDAFIHIVPDALGDQVAARMRSFGGTLGTLGFTVSTGRVVDFRVEDYLRDEPEPGTIPLIYPTHFAEGFIRWPRLPGRKPNALVVAPETTGLLVPSGHYVLVKRFSAKEERRRVVAALFDPACVPGDRVAFENHVNYYHDGGVGLPIDVAKGLTAFLNSTLVDTYFRQFNGHTQVNATDLRSLRYPTLAQLEALGASIGDAFPPRHELDDRIERELLDMVDSPNPIQAQRRVGEALAILKDLGLPRPQHNERSALTLLALLNLLPDTPWAEAAAPMLGITPMMDFFAQHYGKTYAPNSRETVRRQTVHQFMAAALVLQNPDDPGRATNSDQTNYQIAPEALAVLRTFGTDEWQPRLREYLIHAPSLAERYAQARELHRIPLTLMDGTEIMLSPGGQNPLVKRIIDEFCPNFTPGAKPVYVGDTGEKWAFYQGNLLASLGVTIESHGRMPDVVVYQEDKNWLVLIEAVTSHGPVSAMRRAQLQQLFAGSTASLVFVTAFANRGTLKNHLRDISWETEVWVADEPAHLIHFNGERFLGPH